MKIDWKEALANTAPWLAKTLLGPAAGIAVEALCKVVGLEPTTENAEKACQMAVTGQLTAEQFKALKEAEYAHIERMQAMGYDDIHALEEIAFKDRDSARKREVEAHDSGTPRILAGVIVAGFLGCVYFVLSGKVQGLKDPGVATMIGTLIGFVSAKADQVFSYYFGTNASSRAKTEMLFRSTPQSQE